MNISDVKRQTRAKCPHFFSRGTLRFFGQTVRSFKVRTVSGRRFIYAPSYSDASGCSDDSMYYTVREFADGNLHIVRDNDNQVTFRTLQDVMGYFEELKELKQ